MAGEDTAMCVSSLMRFAVIPGLVVTLSLATAEASDAATFELAIGGVHDACTGAHLGEGALTFTRIGTSEHPPSPIRIVTNRGGQFETKLAPGDYGYSRLTNINDDPVSIIFQRTGVVNHFSFDLHSPSPR